MIAVVGEALVDLVAEDTAGSYRAVPGGSPANVALTLARLGRSGCSPGSVAMVSASGSGATCTPTEST